MNSAFRVVTQTVDQLSISMPGSSLIAGAKSLVIAVPMLLVFYLTSRTVARIYGQERSSQEAAQIVLRYRLAGLGLTAVVLALFWAISYTSGSINLDRKDGKATVASRMTIFLPARTLAVPLSDVQEAVLDYKQNARRIRLVMQSGNDVPFPLWTDRAGQDEAVRAINSFVGRKNQ